VDQLLCTKKEGYSSLRISPRSLDYLIESGAIKPIRFGRRVLLKKVDIQKLAQRGFHGRLNQKDRHE
jgi:hypothetical protein